MSNLSFNGVTFIGNVKSLEFELKVEERRDRLGMFNVEVFTENDMLCLIYTSYNEIGIEMLTDLANRHDVEFKATFTGEIETTDNSGYAVGFRNDNGVIETVSRTLDQCGITTLPDDLEEQHELINDAVDSLANTIFELKSSPRGHTIAN